MNKTNISLNSVVDTFESLVDLFTLLSFTLIIATLIYGTQSFQSSSKEVELATIRPGSGQPIDIPDDVVIILLGCKNEKVMLQLIWRGNSSVVADIYKIDLESLIRQNLKKWGDDVTINFVIEKNNGACLGDAYYKINSILSESGIEGYKQYFR